jgi:1-deoxy-D-xylulose-5-phosphate synthase
VVLGDGAYTGGMIHEALNNCRKDLNLIIILNENEMSISKNIGRFASNLSKLRTRPGYFKTKKATGAFLRKIPLIGKWLYKLVFNTKKLFKNMLYSSNYFESMGLTYLGPIDGNDYNDVESLLSEAKKLGESVIVHLKTVKGKGYEPAEQAPDIYHGMAPDGKTASDKVTFSSEMGHIISEIAQEDDRICAITAAMCDGTGLCEFKDRFPSRFFDVGIAEEHALTFAAGLAANGKRPIVALYSTFLQRGFDNVIHDIALQRLPVIICVDRAGLNAGDGATHHGMFDVAFLSEIPDIKIYTPITLEMLRVCIKDALESNMPCAIRYPNGCECEEVVSAFYSGKQVNTPAAVCDFEAGDNLDAVIVTHGRMARSALQAETLLRNKGISVGTVLLEVLKPYDFALDNILSFIPDTTKAIVFVEEEIRQGGMGVNICDELSKRDIDSFKTKIVAVDGTFVADRKVGDSIHTSACVDVDSICNAVEKLVK